MKPDTQGLERLLLEVVPAIWPQRRVREALLDLGENKGWGRADFRDACAGAASWFGSELLLGKPGLLEVEQAVPAERGLTRQEVIARSRWLLGPSGRSCAVSQAIEELAPLVGCGAPKTLDNSLTGGLKSRRPDHLWLATIAGGPAALPGEEQLLFHSRTRTGMGWALERLQVNLEGGRLDAVDALILLSLLALYQRRRATTAARGNRGRSLGRRGTPKPVAALRGRMITHGQARALVEHAVAAGEVGRGVALLALEWSFTDAHLAPHGARSGAAASEVLPARQVLRQLDKLLATSGLEALIQPHHVLFRYRLSRMRAYLDKASPVKVSGLPEDHAYVAISEALSLALRQPSSASLAGLRRCEARLSRDEPGAIMLAPMVRSALGRLRG